MRFFLVVLMLSMECAHADFKEWIANVDKHYSPENNVVSLASVENEYKFLTEKYALQSSTVPISSLKKELQAAGERYLAGADKRSDVYLGYLYCDVAGINARILMEATRCNEMLLTLLVIQIVSDVKIESSEYRNDFMFRRR